METAPRTRSLLEGILAGLVLALADWAASGLARTPIELVVATLAGGLLGGALCGGLAAALARPRLAPALALLAGILLEGLSTASKELPSKEHPLGFGVVVLVAAMAFLGSVRRSSSRPGSLAVVAALPAGAGLAARLGTTAWAHLAGAATPLLFLLVVAALERALPAQRLARALAWSGVLALLAPAQLGGSGVLESPPSPTAETAHGPSLVLLVIDTLRADAVSPGGELARFAREGVEFRQCISAAPWTLPAVASLLTGRYPSEHGAVTLESPLAADVTTLAELLRARGYATGAFTGGAFVGVAHGLQRGFEVFDPTCERTLNSFGGYTPLLWRVAKNRYWPQRWLMDWVDAYRGLAGGLEAARTWAGRQGERPKFLLLHTYQVHDYFLYEPELDDPVLATSPPPSQRFAGRLWVDPREFPSASAADMAHFEALYRGRLAAVERLFPRLVHELEPLVGPDAIWVVTADHGEGFDAARHRVHHGGRLHEDLLRVPLILRAPGRLEPGRVVPETVRTIDVLPTVLELLGLEPPEGLSGESLLPALHGARPFPAYAISEERNPDFDLLSLRRDGWKWIQGPRRQELYRLEDDPGELNPLPSEPPAALREELESFREHHPVRASTEVDLDAATLQHLRSLGYGN